MDKIDLAKTDKTYYGASASEPQLKAFGLIPYLAAAGKGAPKGEAFTNATEALYTLAYAVKAICKKEAADFTVAKLEGLWWVQSDKHALEVPREEWHWKLLIRLPAFVTASAVEQARVDAVKKKKDLATLHAVQFETLEEGSCVQMMHIGPYETEPETFGSMHAFMQTNGLVQNGLHHEIYLSDPRKVEPQAMRTILRLPVKNRE
ncbi:GyrI-like domain-containing protein [Paenibacillus sp. MBLB4367]|uniref:GyrI-like domain-containing protein n=1 Tax=Paenibacillus sp. MBLB4367 TaxID=3384767 RepID=UPI003908136C